MYVFDIMRSKEDMLKVLAAGRAKRMANLKAKKGKGKVEKVAKKVAKKECKCSKKKKKEYDTNDTGI